MKRNALILLLFFVLANFAYAGGDKKIAPCELIYFTANTVKDTIEKILIVQLSWATAAESSMDKFIIERLDDPIKITLSDEEYEAIGEVKATGNSSIQKDYKFTDTLELDKMDAMYRLKLKDLDGQTESTTEIFVFNSIDVYEHVYNENTKVFPNPASDIIHIESTFQSNELVNIQILDLNGHIVKELSKHENGNIVVYVSDLLAGTYVLTIVAGNTIESRKVQIVR